MTTTTEPAPATPRPTLTTGAAGTTAATGATGATGDAAGTAPRGAADGAALAELPVVPADRYVVDGEHGRGGLGRVVRASDRHLGREVAIKELLRDDDPELAARFVREALVTARLQHPGIVPIYDAGRWPDGAPFYAMKLVSGQDLQQAVAARPTLAERLALVPRVHAAAEAVAFAHSRGVIHRDLKPANLMLGPFGETLVVDWGLAKDLDVAAGAHASARAGDDAYVLAHLDMTRDGAVVGTPAYMPPEQAAGEPVDARADVFALGAMLYHVLAGEPPFPRGIARPEERPHGHARPGVPRDLVAIVDKAMAPEADARYPTARELADDLGRFLAGQLVTARAYGPLAAAIRRLARRRVPALVAAALVALLVATAAVSVWRIVQARGAAEARAVELTLAQAVAMIDRDPTAALAWIRRYPADGADRAAARALAADAVGRGVARHVLGGHLEGAAAAAWSPDGAWIASVDGATVRLWDAARGQLAGAWDAPGAWQVAFAGDGSAVGVTGAQGHVWRLDVAARALDELGRAPPWQDALVVAPDGGAIVARGSDGALRRFAPGAPPVAIGADARPGTLAALDRGIVAAGADGVIRRWDAPWAGAPVAVELGRSPGVVTALAAGGGVVAWAAGRDVIVAGSEPRDALPAEVVALAASAHGVAAAGGDGRVWAATAGEPWRELPLRVDDVVALAFGPAGELAASDRAGTARVLDRGVVRALRGHRRPITSLAYTEDGTLLTAGNDGAVRVWARPAPAWRAHAGDGDVFALAWRDDGALVAGTRDGGVSDVDGAVAVRRRGAHRDAVYGVVVDPARDRVVTAGWDGQVVAWAGGPRVLARLTDRVWSLALDPATGRVAAASASGEVVEVALDGRVTVVDRLAGLATAVAFSPDGAALAWGGEHGEVRLRRDGDVVALDGVRGRIAALALTDAGATVYAAGHDGRVVAWDGASRQARELVHSDRPVRALALSADGRWLVAGGQDRLVHVIDTGSGAARTLAGHDGEVRAVSVSADGAWIASAGWDDTARLWRARDGAQAVMRGHDGYVQRVVFSPDERWLASAGADGTVVRWSVDAVRAELPAADGLRAWIDAHTSATVQVGAEAATPQASQSPRR